jgi:hypothetical protein
MRESGTNGEAADATRLLGLSPRGERSMAQHPTTASTHAHRGYTAGRGSGTAPPPHRTERRTHSTRPGLTQQPPAASFLVRPPKEATRTAPQNLVVRSLVDRLPLPRRRFGNERRRFRTSSRLRALSSVQQEARQPRQEAPRTASEEPHRDRLSTSSHPLPGCVSPSELGGLVFDRFNCATRSFARRAPADATRFRPQTFGQYDWSAGHSPGTAIATRPLPKQFGSDNGLSLPTVPNRPASTPTLSSPPSDRFLPPVLPPPHPHHLLCQSPAARD